VRAERKRKAVEVGVGPTGDQPGTGDSSTVSFMKELRRMERGSVCFDTSVVWLLDNLYDEYGTMRAGSSFRLGVAKATMELHVKGMAPAKRQRLAKIIGDFSDEDDKEKDAEGPGVVVPVVTSP